MYAPAAPLVWCMHAYLPCRPRCGHWQTGAEGLEGGAAETGLAAASCEGMNAR